MQQDDIDRPGEAVPTLTKKVPPKPKEPDPVQIIADAIRRHVPTASSDQIKDTAKEVVGRLEQAGKLIP